MFTHLDTITPIQLKSVDGPKGRFYNTPGGKYPSITTILGSGEKPWLTSWRDSLGPIKADKEMKRASDRGTAVHLMLERFVNNDPNPTRGQQIDHINEFKSLRNYIRPIDNILLQEAALYSDTMKIAGRVDLISDYKRRIATIDYKTSTGSKTEQMIQNYFLQTTAYSLMVGEMYDIIIEDIVIIMSVERGVPLVFKGKVDDYIEDLLKKISEYYKKNKVS
ncbi:PD-(D/E)XK nuclease family protein [Candidatus Dojkabacteria bacterium]|jgi:genome maintenance exonuclease 1|nr:PD-(D/E)XK nuclease family protein [Candidatus Dojkabacteria bacterium]